MKSHELLAAAIINSHNLISEAAYVTQSRTYRRYYIASRVAPHATVLYVDEETGELTDNTSRFEAELKSAMKLNR